MAREQVARRVSEGVREWTRDVATCGSTKTRAAAETNLAEHVRATEPSRHAFGRCAVVLPHDGESDVLRRTPLLTRRATFQYPDGQRGPHRVFVYLVNLRNLVARRARGWVEYKHGYQLPDPVRELEARARMTSNAVYLNPGQREELHQQIAETCEHKGWTLLAVNCRSNHIHALISASTTPKKMRAALKAWCSQRLNDQQRAKGITGDDATTVWWADRGSIRWLFDDNSVGRATVYVRDEQDNSQRFENANR